MSSVEVTACGCIGVAATACECIGVEATACEQCDAHPMGFTYIQWQVGVRWHIYIDGIYISDGVHTWMACIYPMADVYVRWMAYMYLMAGIDPMAYAHPMDDIYTSDGRISDGWAGGWTGRWVDGRVDGRMDTCIYPMA